MPPARRRRVVLAQPPRPGPSAATSAHVRALRERLALPPSATPQEVVNAATARVRALGAPPAPPAPALVPAPPRPAPSAAPLVSAAGPTLEELAEEARWEQTTSRLFPEVGLGPATAALAAAGAPLPSAAEVDGARRDAWQAEFARNAEADHRAQVAADDAVRATRVAAGAADRQAREAASDRLLFPELGR